MTKILMRGAAALALLGLSTLAAAQNYGGAAQAELCNPGISPAVTWGPCYPGNVSAGQPPVYVNPPVAYGWPGAIAGVPGYAGQFDRDGDGTPDNLDRDRDGDGVRNSRDRYPDDARYR
jgi:hypothetical protein